MDKQLEQDKAKIEDYLLGRLNPTEEANLLATIKQRGELREELKRQEKLIKGFRETRVERIESMLEGWEEEDATSPDVKTAKVLPLWRWYRWAAAAGVLIVISVAIWTKTVHTQNEMYRTLIANTYEAPGLINPYNSKSITTSGSHSFTEGFQLFKEGKYSATIQNFSEVSSIDSFFIDVQIIRGLSYMGLEDYDSAIPIFVSLLESELGMENKLLIKRQGLFKFQKVDIEWLLAQAYLAKGKKRKSISILKKLIEKDQGYKSEAIKLFEYID